LIALTPAGVRAKWGWISSGLSRVIDRAGSDFVPEDVYHEVMSGRSTVMVQHNEAGDEVGFVVVNRVQYPHKAVLFVWAMYGEFEEQEELTLAQLDELARSIGASEVECRSRRKGWARKGFEACEIIYRRKV